LGGINNIVSFRFIVKLRLIYKATCDLVTPRCIVKLRFIVKSRSNCSFVGYLANKCSINVIVTTRLQLLT